MADARELIDRVCAELESADPARAWFALAVVRARYPDQFQTLRFIRRIRLDGAHAALGDVLARPQLDLRTGGPHWPEVRVAADEVVVDVHHTARTTLATGIQRVARQTVPRWYRDHPDLTLVAWTVGLSALRGLAADEHRNLIGGERPADADDAVVVPWRGRYICPELPAEPERTRAIQSMLRFSNTRGAIIGFDCVPITSAETTAGHMGSSFATMLAAAAHAERVATISQSAAIEFRGWRSMLAGAGLRGPDVRPVPLPAEVPPVEPTSVAEARATLAAGGRPLVLCVGSHEPRKNHLAVLHAAEVLWIEGLEFELAFVGGNSWRSEIFNHEVTRLAAAGRPVRTVQAVSDALLFGAYRIAHCLIFPSLNEGFGLPVGEALASGTPVITSDYGSMREITAGGGALLVDPRDDRQLVDALRRVLTDQDLYARLKAETAAFRSPTWDDYADRTWRFLTDGVTDRPAAQAATGSGRL